MSRSPITTHVLDTALGRPAEGVQATLFRSDGTTPLGRAATNEDGRIEDLLGGASLEAGDYRLCFDTATYYRRQGLQTFYPIVAIEFTVESVDEHYHVPLLVSPYGYSTYRGS